MNCGITEVETIIFFSFVSNLRQVYSSATNTCEFPQTVSTLFIRTFSPYKYLLRVCVQRPFSERNTSLYISDYLYPTCSNLEEQTTIRFVFLCSKTLTSFLSMLVSTHLIEVHPRRGSRELTLT